MSSIDEEELSKTHEEKIRLEQLREAIIAQRLREKEKKLRQESSLTWAQGGTIQQSSPRQEKKRRTKKKSISCGIL